jgi:YidC/Oxa1 family membrane protein insertase
MDRVQIAALVFAVVAFALYYATLPAPTPREAPPPRAPESVVEVPPGEPVAPPDDAGHPVMTQRQTVELENDAVRLRVSSKGGRLEAIQLLGFPDRKRGMAGPVELVTSDGRGTLLLSSGDAALRPLEEGEWQVTARDARSVMLRVERSGVELTRRLELDASGYGVEMRVGIRNRADFAIRPRLELAVYAREREPGAADRFLNYSVVWDQAGEIQRAPVAGIGSPGFFSRLFGGGGNGERAIAAPVEVIGADSQYFLLGVASDNPRETQALVTPLDRDFARVSLQYGVMEVPPGTSVERTWRVYMGPKVPELVRSVDPRFEPLTAVGWGWVQPLVHLFAAVLKWLNDHVVGNYGWAIIIITIALRIATYPLTQRSMQSMKKFSAIAPDMKALQDRYANDRAKLQEEIMKLYREKGINPLSSLGGGCIPMLIQMPFMIALYFALQSSIELRHAPFLGWIDDLSAPEDLRLFGFPIRLLPLAMGASMVLQQRLTPAPTADPQQRQMMTLMSVLFVVLFYGFPSGLVLYWFVSNLLGIGQQLLVNRAPAKAG